MITRKMTLSVLFAIAVPLAGCGESVWDKPPNVTGSAVVEQIEKDTRYSKAFGSGSTVYVVKLNDSDASLRYVRVSGSNIEDSDMTQSIGKRVAIKCYREEPEGFCYASSYSFAGRELVVKTK